MTALYNEIDPYAADWLENLISAGHIAPGIVDRRDIRDIRPDELGEFTQCHFFAGIGVWSYSLRRAGWPDDRPVWTGSCPCQGLSSATRGRPRQPDLWPAFRNLISATRPKFVFGEQVARSEWAARVCDEMEAMGFDFAGAVLPALMVGKHHRRPRFYFGAYSHRNGKPERTIYAKMERRTEHDSHAGSLPNRDGAPSRVGRLRAYGNAIIAPVAEAFIRDFCDAVENPSP